MPTLFLVAFLMVIGMAHYLHNGGRLPKLQTPVESTLIPGEIPRDVELIVAQQEEAYVRERSTVEKKVVISHSGQPKTMGVKPSDRPIAEYYPAIKPQKKVVTTKAKPKANKLQAKRKTVIVKNIPTPITHVATSIPAPIKSFSVPAPLPEHNRSQNASDKDEFLLPDVRRVRNVGGVAMPERKKRA